MRDTGDPVRAEQRERRVRGLGLCLGQPWENTPATQEPSRFPDQFVLLLWLGMPRSTYSSSRPSCHIASCVRPSQPHPPRRTACSLLGSHSPPQHLPAHLAPGVAVICLPVCLSPWIMSFKEFTVSLQRPQGDTCETAEAHQEVDD